jgi:exodeoxyribonuclease VII large subunit
VPAATSADAPLPVRVVAGRMQEWIGRLGQVWIEGQIAEFKPRGDNAWVTLRDPSADMSLTLVLGRRIVDAALPPLAEGQRVIVSATPEFWPKRGTLVMRGHEIRGVGLGELLARLEHLRQLLASEGLFAAHRKRPVPFLPRRVGLVCGRASAAERDVVENARRRWPAVEFEVREVAVQGVNAAVQVGAAVTELDQHADVDVIVITRGGGSLEDLLPFSDETLLRLVANIATPIISAIGHEQDTPLLDLVADARASTPTHAAALIVPDVAELATELDALRRRSDRAIVRQMEVAVALLAGLRLRRPLADPMSLIDLPGAQLQRLREASVLQLRHRLDREATGIIGLRAQVRSLSPAATLERGYAIVQRTDGFIVSAPAELTVGEDVTVRVAGGSFGATPRSA